MQGEMHRNPDVFAMEVGNPISSSRGYQFQYPTRSGTCRGKQYHSKKKSRLQPFSKQGETLDRATTGAPLTEYNNKVGSGAQRSPPRCSSPSSWFRYLSPTQFGGATFEHPSYHPKLNDNAGDEQPPTALSHPIEIKVANLVVAAQHLSSEVV